MTRTLRRIFLAVAALAMAGAGGGAWILLQGDALEKALLDQISASLLTRGHITEVELSLWDEFPLVSLSLHGVWLAGSGAGGPGAGPFSGDTLLRADRISLTLDAFSLFSEQPRIESLHVHNATVALAERSGGAWNTDVWKADSSSEAFSFQIEQLQLDAVRLQVAETRVQIARSTCQGTIDETGLDAQVDASLEALGQPVNVQFRVNQTPTGWQFSELAASALGADAVGTFALEGTTPALHLEVTNLEWRNVVELGVIDLGTGWTGKGTFGGEVNWDGKAWKGHAKTNEFTVSLPEGVSPWYDDAPSIPLEGSCSGTAWFRVAEDWRMDVPNLRARFPGMEGELELHWTPSELHASGTAAAAPACALWWSKDWDGTWEGGKLVVDFDASQSKRGTNLQAQITGSGLRGWHEGTAWSADVQAELNDQSLQVLPSRVGWGDSTWELDGEWEDPFSGGAYNGTIRASTNRFVVESGSGNSEKPWWHSLKLPPSSRVNAEIRVGKLVWEGNEWTDVSSMATVSPGLVEWHGEGGAWGGAVSATGALRWQELGARLDLAYEAQQVNVRTLFQQMENFDQTTLRSEHISGLLDSEGTLLFPWKSNGSVDWDRVNWQGNQTLRSATLENVEALMSIPDYLSEHRMAAPLIHPDDLRSKLRFVALHPIQTPIYFFQSAFHIPSYVFKTDDLHVSLEGVHGLSGEMDYSVGIELRELRAKTSDDIGEVADDGLGNHLFIKMSGTFEALNYAWDREAQRAHRRKDFQAEGEKLRALWLRNRTE